MNTDGNLASLNEYQREVDRDAEEEIELERARQALVTDLMDAYLRGHESVVMEVASELYFDASEQVEEMIRAALTDPDYDLAGQYRDLLTEFFEDMVRGVGWSAIGYIRRDLHV